jgi:mono/diheme cytochrome c family protein
MSPLNESVRTRGIALVALLALGACAAEPKIGGQGREVLGARDRGEATAKSQCASCHFAGKDGVGTRVDAPSFGQIAVRYRDLRLDWELETISQVGHYAMPAKPLAPGQVADLTAYIRSLDHQARDDRENGLGPDRPDGHVRRIP